MALNAGMKVDGVVYAGAAITRRADLTTPLTNTPWLVNYYSDSDATNYLTDGAGRYGFSNPYPTVNNVYVPYVDHFFSDIEPASSHDRVGGYTEWDSYYMAFNSYAKQMPSHSSTLSVRMSPSSSPGYYLHDSGVK